MQENMFEVMIAGQMKQECMRVLSCNEKTKQFGLSLSEADAQMLVAARSDTLKAERRVEFGGGILSKIIFAFCDSVYIEQDQYAEAIAQLQEIFYLYKNESMDNLTDDELLEFMREHFDGVCYGSLDYLGTTCLEEFSRAIRAGYDGYIAAGSGGGYSEITDRVGWDRNLFLETISELIV